MYVPTIPSTFSTSVSTDRLEGNSLQSTPHALPPNPSPQLTSCAQIAERVKNFAVIYLCDLDQVPDFNQMYELYDPLTIMFFWRNKHMMCDFGTGNNNKMNWLLESKEELIDIVETIYRGARKGRGLVVSPKDYSTRYRY